MYDLAEEKIKKRMKEMVSEIKDLKKEKEELQVELDTLARTNQLVGAGEYEKHQKLTIEISQLEEMLKKLQSKDTLMRHETFYSILEKEKQSEIEAFQVTANTNDPLTREYGKKRLAEVNKELVELKKFFRYIDFLKEKKHNLEIMAVEIKGMNRLRKELSSKYQAVLDLSIVELSDRELSQTIGNLRKESPQILDKMIALNHKLDGLKIEGLVPLSNSYLRAKQSENPVEKTREDGINEINRYKKECWIAQNNHAKYYSFLVSLTAEYKQMETKKMSISEKNRQTATVKKVIHNLKSADERKRDLVDYPFYLPIIETSNPALTDFKQRVEDYDHNKLGVNKESDSSTRLSIISEGSYESVRVFENQGSTTSEIRSADSQIASGSDSEKGMNSKGSGFEKNEISGIEKSQQHMDDHMEGSNYDAADSRSIILEADLNEIRELTKKKLVEMTDKINNFSHMLNAVEEDIKKSGEKNASKLLLKKQVLQADIELHEELKGSFKTKLENYQKSAITKAAQVRSLQPTNENKKSRER